AIGDSAEIALYLERTYPAHSLLPTELDARTKVLDIEAFFDDRDGGDVRRYLYGKLMESPGRAAQALFSFYSGPSRLLGKIVGGRIEALLRRMYTIEADTVRSSRSTIIDAIDRIEQLTDGNPGRYLVSDRLTLADVTAASLLGPVVMPPGTPWEDVTDLPA